MIKEIEYQNNLAIRIIKRIKILVEAEFFIKNNESNKIQINEIIKEINENNSIKTKKFSLELWESNKDFYVNLFEYSNFYLKKLLNFEKPKLNYLPKSSFAINGLLNLLNFILNILQNYKEAYKNDKIKFLINILCEILTGKSKKIINNGIFYQASIFELKNEFKELNYNEHKIIKKINEIFKEKALKKIERVKNDLFDYIIHIYDVSTFNLTENINDEINKYSKIINNKSIEEKNKILEIIDELGNKKKDIKNTFLKFKQIKKNYKNSNELIDNCIKNEKIFNYFKEFSSYYYKKLNKSIEEKYILNNILLPSGIFNIDLTNQEDLNIIYDIEYNKKYEFDDNFIEIENTFYEKYLKIKEEINEFKKSKSYENEINNIIYNDNFMNEFYNILNSDSVTFYLNNKRKYDDLFNYNVNIILDKNKEADDNLKDQFQQFLSDTKNNYSKFRKLIIIKQLGFKIKSLVDSSMRIFINPILNFSKECNEEQRESILKSYLKLLLLHELINLLKYYPINDKYPEITSITSREKENEELFIYYLFGQTVIYKINYSQSKEINNISNWNNIDKLKKIFKNNEKSLENKNKEGEVNLLITFQENDNNKIKSTDDFRLCR